RIQDERRHRRRQRRANRRRNVDRHAQRLAFLDVGSLSARRRKTTRRRANAGQESAQRRQRRGRRLVVSRLHERRQRTNDLGVGDESRRHGGVGGQRISFVGEDRENLAPAGGVSNRRETGERGGVPTAIGTAGDDRRKFLGSPRVPQRRQHQGGFRR